MSDKTVSRRALVGLAGTGVAIALAGCSEPDDPEDPAPPNGEPAPPE